MKKLFTLLAVVLLTSVSTMAQNDNNSTLKGDVNSDGSVDVADIVAVIDLIQKGQEAGEAGYFYLGTTNATPTNFTTLAGAVTTYTSIDEAVGTKVSVAAGETLYMLCPTSWSKEKSVTLEEGGESVNFSNKDDATISGYTIYETQAWKVSSTVTLKVSPLYWFGITTNESGDYINPYNYKSRPTEIHQVTKIEELRKIIEITGEVGVYLYIVIPAEYNVKVVAPNYPIFETNMARYANNINTYTSYASDANCIIDDSYILYRSAQKTYGDVEVIITKKSQ